MSHNQKEKLINNSKAKCDRNDRICSQQCFKIDTRYAKNLKEHNSKEKYVETIKNQMKILELRYNT